MEMFTITVNLTGKHVVEMFTITVNLTCKHVVEIFTTQLTLQENMLWKCLPSLLT